MRGLEGAASLPVPGCAPYSYLHIELFVSLKKTLVVEDEKRNKEIKKKEIKNEREGRRRGKEKMSHYFDMKN